MQMFVLFLDCFFYFGWSTTVMALTLYIFSYFNFIENTNINASYYSKKVDCGPLIVELNTGF